MPTTEPARPVITVRLRRPRGGGARLAAGSRAELRVISPAEAEITARRRERQEARKVPPTRWNVLAIMALPLAILLPPAGFFAGRSALRQIARTGERGAALASLSWVIGLGLFLLLAAAGLVAAIGFALYKGFPEAAGAVVGTILQWFFG